MPDKAFPKTLFKPGGDEVLWGQKQSTLIVYDVDGEETALREGWQHLPQGAPRADPLDHDEDGRKGGSLKGKQSTRSKGARKKGAKDA